MLKAFKTVNNDGHELCMDFVSSFRSHSVDLCCNRLAYKRCAFLRSKGIHVENGRETPISKSLKILLFIDVQVLRKPRVACKDHHQEDTAPHKAAIFRPQIQHNEFSETHLDR